MKALLNIGLKDRDYAKAITVAQALRTCRHHGIHVIQSAEHEGEEEDVLVVLAECLTPRQSAAGAAADLEQDCVAVWTLEGRRGYLEGPGADKWGEFKPEAFVLMSGEKLAVCV